MVINNLWQSIGNTPILKLGKLSEGLNANIYIKLEFMNPLSSIKDRAAFYMLKDAKDKGLIKEGSTIIEPTSGNTGIGLAYIAKQMGMKVILTMPETMSQERKKLLKMLGAKLVLTEGSLGMQGSIDKANELLKQTPMSYMPMQFENPSNWKAHYEQTAPEILKDLGTNIDIFLTGIGTGGTFTGIAKSLKENIPNIKTYAVEPAESPMISQGKAAPHKIQGIGANFVPKNLDMSLVDKVLTVKGDDALYYAHKAAVEEAIPLGISGGANLAAAIELASLKENRGKNILTIAPDASERYISTALGDFA